MKKMAKNADDSLTVTQMGEIYKIRNLCNFDNI